MVSIVMQISGIEIVQEQIQQGSFFFKAILNDSGACFFSGKTQHSTVKVDGLSYEDDYKGNALAAIIKDNLIEIRNHRDFEVPHVESIIKALLQDPRLECLKDFSVTYRGETIKTE